MCETNMVQMHCDTCLFSLCKACVGEHTMSDESNKKHEIVKFTFRQSTLLYPGCTFHDKKRCEMYCNQCDVPVCISCIISDHHLGHKIESILRILNEKKENIIKEGNELNETIYPTYHDIENDVENMMKQLEKEYGDLATAITKHGDDWCKGIVDVVKKLKTEANEMKTTQLQTLQKHRDKIHERITEIKDEIHSIDIAVDSYEISNPLSVKSNVDDYKHLPPRIIPCLPLFTHKKFEQEEFNKLFGTLSPMSLVPEEHGYSLKKTQKSSDDESSPLIKQLLDKPETIAIIMTAYKYNLFNVVCRNDEEIWTSGDENTMKLFSVNMDSSLKSTQTKSGECPSGIAVTEQGELIYVDRKDRTVNILKNGEMVTVIRLQNWLPLGVCSISPGDLLVTMYSEDKKPSKVVRYSDYREKQTIQLDDDGKPIYLYGEIKYIIENRNRDICVADTSANALVVVNSEGKPRFRYTGNKSCSKSNPFDLHGITTDSQSHILAADCENNCIHIIDQDGQFLCFIECELFHPWGLCIDTYDNLFVTECYERQVKKIKYQQ
ncbi:uncharacterized protein LOC133193196 [Saccostrea echinata]|uniref:uncharacterized protein LOC133193196 n=1 Tax=Saccostrea echinata TaxID=191078 RepID=UPI002A81AE5D|nr:uncharacterized protein LOC133193196 [Saccostrea echinata]